jgi:hypothetical protein
MTWTFRATAAALAFCCVAAPADAAKKSPPRQSLTAIQLECFKQQGAYYDAETKRWMITGDDRNMQSRTETVRDCVAQKTGTRPAPFLREERTYH